jgi:hypothetical protein
MAGGMISLTLEHYTAWRRLGPRRAELGAIALTLRGASRSTTIVTAALIFRS